MTPDREDLLEWIGPWVAQRLEADAYFADIPVLVEDKGATDADIAQALGTINERSGKLGVVAIVNCPEERAGAADMPGPESLIIVPVTVLENPLFNRDATSGDTMKPWPRVGQRVKALLHHFNPGTGQVLYFDGGEREINDAENGYTYRFRIVTGPDPLPKPFVPQISGPASAVQIVSTPGAAIYFTTDGSYPREGGETSTLYTEPFEVEPGTLVTAASYLTNYQGSDIAAKRPH